VSCAGGGQSNSERRRWSREASGAGGATLR